MILKPLPIRSSLERYEKQSKNLVKAYRSGDPEAIRCIGNQCRSLPAPQGDGSLCTAPQRDRTALGRVWRALGYRQAALETKIAGGRQRRSLWGNALGVGTPRLVLPAARIPTRPLHPGCHASGCRGREGGSGKGTGPRLDR